MRNELISITLSEMDGIGFLSFTSEFFYPGKFRKRFSPEDRKYMESDFFRDITTIIDSFIESFPHHQISRVERQIKQKTRSSFQVLNEVNVQTDTHFEFCYGSWFVCSENPLSLTFEEYNELLGIDAGIPYGNWRGGFTRWVAKVLQSTMVTCIGGMSDPDETESFLCFWPVDLQIIESHLEPIMNKYGLKISKHSS